MSRENKPTLQDYVEAKRFLGEVARNHHEVSLTTAGELSWDIEREAARRHLPTLQQAELEGKYMDKLKPRIFFRQKWKKRALGVFENLMYVSADPEELTVIYDILGAQKRPWETDLVTEFGDSQLQSTDSGQVPKTDPGEIAVESLGTLNPIKGLLDMFTPSGRGRREQKILGVVFDLASQYVHSSGNDSHVALRHRNGGLISLDIVTPRDAENPNKVIIRGMEGQRGYVSVKRHAEGVFMLSAGDSQGLLAPPSARRIRRTLANLR